VGKKKKHKGKVCAIRWRISIPLEKSKNIREERSPGVKENKKVRDTVTWVRGNSSRCCLKKREKREEEKMLGKAGTGFLKEEM